MHIESLKYFLAVIEHNSFSKAALEEDISQSSLSKHIGRLEREMYVKLFDRNTHKLVLTEAGQVFAAYAENIVMQHKLMIDSVERYRRHEKNDLHIMMLPLLNLYDLAEMISDFRKTHPMIRIQLTEAEISTLKSKMEHQAVDLAIIRAPLFTPTEDLTIQPLIDDKLILLCSVNHRFAKKEILSLSEITEEHFLMLMPMFDFIERMFMQGSVTIDIERNADLVRDEDVVQQLYSTSSIMLMSTELADRYLEMADNKLIAIPLKEIADYSVALAYKSKNLPPTIKKFVDYAIQYYRR